MNSKRHRGQATHLISVVILYAVCLVWHISECDGALSRQLEASKKVTNTDDNAKTAISWFTIKVYRTEEGLSEESIDRMKNATVGVLNMEMIDIFYNFQTLDLVVSNFETIERPLSVSRRALSLTAKFQERMSYDESYDIYRRNIRNGLSRDLEDEKDEMETGIALTMSGESLFFLQPVQSQTKVDNAIIQSLNDQRVNEKIVEAFHLTGDPALADIYDIKAIVFGSESPSQLPSLMPTHVPSLSLSKIPTNIPSSFSSEIPSNIPSSSPSQLPTNIPSSSPSQLPTSIPSSSPSQIPTRIHSSSPSLDIFTLFPTESVIIGFTKGPTISPGGALSLAPSIFTTHTPSLSPSFNIPPEISQTSQIPTSPELPTLSPSRPISNIPSIESSKNTFIETKSQIPSAIELKGIYQKAQRDSINDNGEKESDTVIYASIILGAAFVLTVGLFIRRRVLYVKQDDDSQAQPLSPKTRDLFPVPALEVNGDLASADLENSPLATWKQQIKNSTPKQLKLISGSPNGAFMLESPARPDAETPLRTNTSQPPQAQAFPDTTNQNNKITKINNATNLIKMMEDSNMNLFLNNDGDKQHQQTEEIPPNFDIDPHQWDEQFKTESLTNDSVSPRYPIYGDTITDDGSNESSSSYHPSTLSSSENNVSSGAFPNFDRDTPHNILNHTGPTYTSTQDSHMHTLDWTNLHNHPDFTDGAISTTSSITDAQESYYYDREDKLIWHSRSTTSSTHELNEENSNVSPGVAAFDDRYSDGDSYQSSKASSSKGSKQLINDLVWLEKRITEVRDFAATATAAVDANVLTLPSPSPDRMASGINNHFHLNTPLTSPISQNIACHDCFVPPGKLNIVIKSTKDGPCVHSVYETSSLVGQLFPGDLIIAVDNVDTRAMSAEQVLRIMQAKNELERQITVLHFGE